MEPDIHINWTTEMVATGLKFCTPREKPLESILGMTTSFPNGSTPNKQHFNKFPNCLETHDTLDGGESLSDSPQV